jgi:phosphate transport system substrate-binding protein
MGLPSGMRRPPASRRVAPRRAVASRASPCAAPAQPPRGPPLRDVIHFFSKQTPVIHLFHHIATETPSIALGGSSRPLSRAIFPARLRPQKGALHVRMNRPMIASLLATLMLACAPAAASARALLIDGSTSIFPLMNQLAAAYHKATHAPTPRVGQGTSGVGISDVASGRADIGDVSRDPILGVDPRGLRFTKIARDGVCVITNPANHLSNLNQQVVQQIFTGQVRNWSEVPGASVSGPIDLFQRVTSSGTQDAFQNIFLGENLKISPGASSEESNGTMRQAVIGDQNGIGFASFAFTGGTNAVSYQGIPCTLRNAKSGQYQGVRNFWMVTKGPPKGAAGAFINWVIKRHNKIAEKIISSQWIAIY